MLTSDTQAPEVSDTTVSSDLLQSLQVVSQLGLQVVSQVVVVLTVVDVLLTVQEPGWDFVLGWVLHDLDDSLQFFLGQLTSSLLQADVSLLAHQVGVTTTDTTDGGQGVNDLDVTIDVSVQQTARELVHVAGLREQAPADEPVSLRGFNTAFRSLTVVHMLLSHSYRGFPMEDLHPPFVS